MEASYGEKDRFVERFWVKIIGIALWDLVVCLLQTPWSGKIGRQLKEASGLQALVLMGDINCSDTCWEINTAMYRQI